MSATEISAEPLTARNVRSSWPGPALWILIAVYLALVIGFAWDPTPLAQGLAAVGIASALLHAGLTYGFRNALALFAICLAVTFAMENLGSITGLIFGHYHFVVGADLPHIGVIPIIVGPLWFGMGYFAWIVAGTLLGGADRRLNRPLNVIVLPLVAALVMTQWDLVMDAPEATISRAWIWHDGGAYFGVPLSNYFGWLLTSWLFYQLFAFYLARRPAARPNGRDGALRLVALLFYLGSGLTHLTPWLAGQSGEATDGAGHVWRIEDLRATTVIVMLSTMFVTSLLAALRLATDDRPSKD